MLRDEIIKILVDDDINGWRDREDQEAYLSMLLKDGFIGYKDWHDQELEDELYDRGIVEDIHPSFDPAFKNEGEYLA